MFAMPMAAEPAPNNNMRCSLRRPLDDFERIVKARDGHAPGALDVVVVAGDLVGVLRQQTQRVRTPSSLQNGCSTWDKDPCAA